MIHREFLLPYRGLVVIERNSSYFSWLSLLIYVTNGSTPVRNIKKQQTITNEMPMRFERLFAVTEVLSSQILYQERWVSKTKFNLNYTQCTILASRFIQITQTCEGVDTCPVKPQPTTRTKNARTNNDCLQNMGYCTALVLVVILCRYWLLIPKWRHDLHARNKLVDDWDIQTSPTGTNTNVWANSAIITLVSLRNQLLVRKLLEMKDSSTYVSSRRDFFHTIYLCPFIIRG